MRSTVFFNDGIGYFCGDQNGVLNKNYFGRLEQEVMRKFMWDVEGSIAKINVGKNDGPIPLIS